MNGRSVYTRHDAKSRLFRLVRRLARLLDLPAVVSRLELCVNRLEPGDPVYITGAHSSYRDAQGHAWSVNANVAEAVAVAQSVRVLGFTPMCPHLAIPPAPDGHEGWTLAMRECLVHLENTRATVMVSNWAWSRGARIEERETRAAGRPVFYSVLELAAAVGRWRRQDPAWADRLDAYLDQGGVLIKTDAA